MKGIQIDSNNDLLVKAGHLVIGDTTAQNQKLLLYAEKGEIKENPIRGVGIRRFVESAEDGGLAREIRKDFALDGMTVNAISINIPTIQIDADYE